MLRLFFSKHINSNLTILYSHIPTTLFWSFWLYSQNITTLISQCYGFILIMLILIYLFFSSPSEVSHVIASQTSGILINSTILIVIISANHFLPLDGNVLYSRQFYAVFQVLFATLDGNVADGNKKCTSVSLCHMSKRINDTELTKLHQLLCHTNHLTNMKRY